MAYTKEERKALNQLKERLKDLKLENKGLLEERRLINWLRARNLNLDKAERMFLRHLKWREEHKIDNILQVNCLPNDADFLEKIPADIVGHDKRGNSILAFALKNFEFKKLVQTYGKEVAMDVIYVMLETAYADIVENSTDPDVFKKAIYIVDIDGFKYNEIMSTDVLDVIISSLKVVEANYPELLFNAFVLNAPFVFSVLWNTLKPFLSPRTLGKVTILGQDQDKIQNTLEQLIDLDQLPRKWGGTGFSERIHALNICTKVNSSSEDMVKGVDAADMLETTIAAGDVFELPHEVETPKAVLSWCFKTKKYDIGFCLLHRPFLGKGGNDENLNDTKEIIEYRRVRGLNSGSFVCDMPGHYILRFDNSYSRFREKCLLYHVELGEFRVNGNYDEDVPSSLPSSIIKNLK